MFNIIITIRITFLCVELMYNLIHHFLTFDTLYFLYAPYVVLL